MGEFVRTTAEPHQNAATMYTTSVMVSLQPHPWFSFGVQAPFTVVDEDAPGVGTKVGYGDTRLELRLTPQDDPSAPQVFTFGLNASLPTRSVRFQVDPGPMWHVAPLVAYTRSYGALSWQAVLLTPVEHRPAGTAFEASGALILNYRILSPWAITGGALADIRVASRCSLPGGGSEWCSEGRVTELRRDNGATRGYLTLGSGLDLAETWTLSVSAQVPFTERRDFAVAASAGIEARF